MCSYLPRHGKKEKKTKAAVVDFEKLTLDGMLLVVMFADNSCPPEKLIFVAWNAETG